MLMADPAVLRDLITQYESLAAQNAEEGGAEEGGAEVRRRLDDVAYTLCVSTGTRDVETALVAARHQLPGARPEGGSATDD